MFEHDGCAPTCRFPRNSVSHALQMHQRVRARTERLDGGDSEGTDWYRENRCGQVRRIISKCCALSTKRVRNWRCTGFEKRETSALKRALTFADAVIDALCRHVILQMNFLSGVSSTRHFASQKSSEFENIDTCRSRFLIPSSVFKTTLHSCRIVMPVVVPCFQTDSETAHTDDGGCRYRHTEMQWSDLLEESGRSRRDKAISDRDSSNSLRAQVRGDYRSLLYSTP